MSVIAPRHSGDASRSASGAGWAGFARRVGYAAALLPASLATMGAVAVGRPDGARAWWARAGRPDPVERTTREPGPGRLLAHAFLCLPLGLLAVVPVGMEVLFVLRGVLYPLVDRGPYDHSWGGPTVGGAWLAHFVIALPFALAALGSLWLLDRLHARLAGRLWGRRVGAAPVVTAAVAAAAGFALVVAWTHQL